MLLEADTEECKAADVDGNNAVSVAELVNAVNASLFGCFVTPPSRTQTPTRTNTRPRPSSTPKATRTMTPTKTHTRTPTLRPTVRFGCPTKFSDHPGGWVCVFEGRYNETCGKPDFRGTFETRESGVRINLGEPPIFYLRGVATGPGSAQLLESSASPEFKEPVHTLTEVTAQLSQDGKSLEISTHPFWGLLVLGRCAFDRYEGDFIRVNIR